MNKLIIQYKFGFARFALSLVSMYSLAILNFDDL